MLPIFPEGSLVSSVVTTTWVGVFVLCFFNLRLGWVLSGIVVPGYLVPLLLVKPWAAAVITGEAVATYLIVLMLSEQVSRAGIWSSFFGRDRFFAIILVSIGVRLAFDGWLLPQIGEAVNTTFGLSFDYRNELHSFGLVIVALMANQFWKPGLVRSIVPAVVTIGLTYLIVRFGLLEFTNFRMSDLGFMYEELASSILASPKAYIVLVVTAFLASRMNLVYGWDFNGILIPALIALQWWQPWKVVASFAEAFIIYGLAVLLLRLPVFANVTVEGARKLLLFFNVGFAYKLALGWGLALYAPTVKASDYFAFGYLLSTLLAIKMHDKEIIARLTRATVQTSLTGAAVASVLGFALTLVPDTSLRDRTTDETAAEIAEGTTLEAHADAISIRAYGLGLDAALQRPTPTQVGALESAAGRLMTAARAEDTAGLERAAADFRALGYRLTRLGAHHLAAVNADARRGWATLVVRTGPAADLVVELPDPLERGQLVTAGLSLYRDLDARVLILAGSSRSARRAAVMDPLADVQTAFHAFHRAAARQNVLQVRGRPDGGDQANGLIVKASLPPALSPKALSATLPDLAVTFGTGPGTNVQRQSMWTGFAELYLTAEGTARLITGLRDRTAPEGARVPVLDAPGLGALFDDGVARIATADSGGYRPPQLAELLFFDREVLTPLLASATQEAEADAGRRSIAAVGAAAEAVGYRLFRHAGAGGALWVLAERPDSQRGWGTYVIRDGRAAPIGVQVPRPLSEPGTLSTGIDLFRRTRARALLVSGAHPNALPDRAADLLRRRNASNVFNLASQVLYRESGNAPFMAAQLRGFAPRPAAPADAPPEVVLAAADGATRRADLSPVGQRIAAIVGEDRRLAFADGSPSVAGLDVGRTPQAAYLDQARNDRFLTVWVSRSARQAYSDKAQDALEAAHFVALDMADRTADALDRLRGAAMVRAPDGLIAGARAYARSRDVLALAQLRNDWPAYRFSRLVDTRTRQSLLLARDGADQLALVASLAGDGEGPVNEVAGRQLGTPALSRVLDARRGLVTAAGPE